MKVLSKSLERDRFYPTSPTSASPNFRQNASKTGNMRNEYNCYLYLFPSLRWRKKGVLIEEMCDRHIFFQKLVYRKKLNSVFQFWGSWWGARGCHFWFGVGRGSWERLWVVWGQAWNSHYTLLWLKHSFWFFGQPKWTIYLAVMRFWSNQTWTSKIGNMRNEYNCYLYLFYTA